MLYPRRTPKYKIKVVITMYIIQGVFVVDDEEGFLWDRVNVDIDMKMSQGSIFFLRISLQIN